MIGHSKTYLCSYFSKFECLKSKSRNTKHKSEVMVFVWQHFPDNLLFILDTREKYNTKMEELIPNAIAIKLSIEMICKEKLSGHVRSPKQSS